MTITSQICKGIYLEQLVYADNEPFKPLFFFVFDFSRNRTFDFPWKSKQ